MTTPPISRRDFFRCAGGAAVAAAWGVPAAGAEPVRVGLVLPRSQPSAGAVRAGAELGAAEARRLADLIGASFELAVAEAPDAGAAVSAARDLVRGRVGTVVGGVDGRFCEALAAALPERYLAVRARQDVAPRAQAIRHLSVTPPYRRWATALTRGLARSGLRRYALDEDDAAFRAATRQAGLVEVEPQRAEVVFSAPCRGAAALWRPAWRCRSAPAPRRRWPGTRRCAATARLSSTTASSPTAGVR